MRRVPSNQTVTGIKELKDEAEARIRNGMVAYANLQKLKSGDTSGENIARIRARQKADLGYGLLLKKYTPNVVDATPEQIKRAAPTPFPSVAPLFWSFRLMVALGFLFLFIFAASFYFLAVRNLAPQRWLMKLALWSIPLPWIAAELGWVVAEYGRQPWTISGVLPTFLSVSNVPAVQRLFQPGRLFRVLHVSAGRRDVPDVQIRPPGAEQPAHRALRS